MSSDATAFGGSGRSSSTRIIVLFTRKVRAVVAGAAPGRAAERRAFTRSRVYPAWKPGSCRIQGGCSAARRLFGPDVFWSSCSHT